jgi:hypothetical protein
MPGNDPWVAKEMVDFTVAGKKSPVHTSISGGVSIVGTNATLYGTHLTTDLNNGT